MILEQSCGPLAVEIFPGNTAISTTILPRQRELSLAHAQRCCFLILEQSSGPLGVEMVPGKHCDFIRKIGKCTRAHSGACVEVLFPDYGKELWSTGSRNNSRKALRFQHLSCQETESSVFRIRRGEIS
jgi:hypothetical protein